MQHKYRVTSYGSGSPDAMGRVIKSTTVEACSYDEARRRSGVSGAVVGIKAL